MSTDTPTKAVKEQEAAHNPRSPRLLFRHWSRDKRILQIVPFISIAGAFLIWVIGQSRMTFVPTPGEVWDSALQVLVVWDTYASVLLSLQRLILGFSIAMVIGLLASIWAARNQIFDSILSSYVRFMFSLPSLLVALLALVAFGRQGYAAVIVVAVLVFPFTTVPLQQGIRSMDRSLIDMSKVYRASSMETVRHIALPHLAPYLFASIRNGHALAWKVLIVAEIFTVNSGIGEEFTRAFGLFDLPGVMVWVGIFLASVAIVEYGILSIVERRVFRWRSGT